MGKDKDVKDDNPVATGLIALVGVGLVVGLLISGAALAVTQVVGLGDGGSGGGSATAQQSMNLPTPSPTEEQTGPLITLAPSPGDGLTSAAPPSATPTPTAAVPTISLAASTTQARPGENITLSGTYPGAEGARVVVERLSNGAWTDFAGISATVSNATFSTYIRTSQSGDNTFRVRDTATDLASNEVTFTIG